MLPISRPNFTFIALRYFLGPQLCRRILAAAASASRRGAAQPSCPLRPRFRCASASTFHFFLPVRRLHRRPLSPCRCGVVRGGAALVPATPSTLTFSIVPASPTHEFGFGLWAMTAWLWARFLCPIPGINRPGFNKPDFWNVASQVWRMRLVWRLWWNEGFYQF